METAMKERGGDRPPSGGGEFLLSLLQGSNQQVPYSRIPPSSINDSTPVDHQHELQRSTLAIDPAVAEVGPAILLPHQLHQFSIASRPLAPAPYHLWPDQPYSVDQRKAPPDDLLRLGLIGSRPNQQFLGESVSNLQFGTMSTPRDDLVSAVQNRREVNNHYNFPDLVRHQQQPVRPFPGFSAWQRGGGYGRESIHRGTDRGFGGRIETGFVARNCETRHVEQLDRSGRPPSSVLQSVSPADVESSLMKMKLMEDVNDAYEEDGGEVEVEVQNIVESLLKGETEARQISRMKGWFKDKDFRSDARGQRTLPQRMRLSKCRIPCRSNIAIFDRQFLAIYESLIPSEQEQANQVALLERLEKLVKNEWFEAKLHLYGSCANSFGVSKSDIDVCLAIDATLNKSEVLLKLADLLESDNFLDVQALTRARVPIVKLRDPETGISCDICVNNLLAVVNTKLLRDYAKIDVRLRQLAFIVKHWAKSRSVNQTYQGTLSSYAYVLMCIHFLQLRGPAVLPCLQEMEPTFSVTVDDIRCYFFDQVERIEGFGSRNRETISQLVWGFFNYWAYCHDYANDVVSVRTGSIIRKREKDWTRRVGNDRHLICIEDPFEVSHDLGRVVDKFSIKVLREEFERAAEIMQFDANPSSSLFELYIPP